jgi:O-antigen/teichoic acid export membrane protein
MHLTEIQKSEIQREFVRRRRKQLVLSAVFIPIIFAVLLFQRGMVGTIFGVRAQVASPAFLVLAVGALLFSLRNWRCPACSKSLGRGINPRNCPNCGTKLRA